MIRDHRLGGLKGITCGAGQIAFHPRVPHHARFPSHAGADNELFLLGQVFQDLAEFTLQADSRDAARFLEQFGRVMSLESETAEFSD